MLEEIKQNGKVILSSSDTVSIPVIFNNLIGKNFKNKEYKDYIEYVAYRSMGFAEGKIQLFRDGEQIEEGIITIKK
ncbi:DUF7688 family protein [Parabacteroides sp.]